jgi:hypothetical protein
MKLANKFLEDEESRNKTKIIIFTDEKTFRRCNDSKTTFIKRKKNEAYKKKNVRTFGSTKSQADISVWGYIGPFGKGKLNT